MKFWVRLRMNIRGQDGRIRVQKSFKLPLADLVPHKVHLRENVDVRNFQHDHATHRTERPSKKLCLIDDECGLKEIRRAEVERHVTCEMLGQVRQDGDVRVEFYLAGTVEYCETFFAGFTEL